MSEVTKTVDPRIAAKEVAPFLMAAAFISIVFALTSIFARFLLAANSIPLASILNKIVSSMCQRISHTIISSQDFSMSVLRHNCGNFYEYCF